VWAFLDFARNDGVQCLLLRSNFFEDGISFSFVFFNGDKVCVVSFRAESRKCVGVSRLRSK
jgi:hypothetical protein